MTFDFKKAKAAASKPQQIRPMKAIVLGTSGAGKSSLLGTTGLDVVMLYGKTEEHGPTAAQTMSNGSTGSVTPVEYTIWKDKGGRLVLDADASIDNLRVLLSSKEISNEFGAVALDSITELQSIFMQTQEFVEVCRTDKGVHNKWAEGDAFVKFFEEIRDQLIGLQGKGLHSFVTCAANKNPVATDSTVTSYEPTLRGFKVAQEIIRMFDDVLLVDRFEGGMEDDDGNIEDTGHRIIFKANLAKKAKDLRGNVTKSMNFQPRVSGFKIQDLPSTCEADLGKIISGRQKAFSKA